MGGGSARARVEAGEPAQVTEPANCLGVTSKGAAQLRGTGALALGSEKLVFDYWVINRTIAIPRRAIRRVEHVRSHLGKSVFTKLLKVSFVNEEHQYDSVAFRVTELEDWTRAIEAVCEENAARVGRPVTEESPLARAVRGRALRRPAWTDISPRLGVAWGMLSGGLLAIPWVGALVGGPLFLGGLAWLGAAWFARRKFAKRLVSEGAEYTADRNGLTLGGELVVEAWRVKSGVVVPMPASGGVEVRLDLGALRRDVLLRVATVEEGRAILEALGVGTRDRAVTRHVTSRMFTARGYFAAVAPLLVGAPLTGLLAAVGLVPSQVFALGFVAGLAWLLVSFYTLGLVKTRLTIGADGVRIAWLGRARVIGLTEIARVDTARSFGGGSKVIVHLHSGEAVPILIAARGNNLFEPFDPMAEAALIVERLRDALRLGAEVKEAKLDAWMENQAGLSTKDFIRELRLHVRSGMKERGAEMLQGLLQAVEHASTAPALRAAAAIALGPLLDDTTRARLRAAAAASAQPRVRVALEAAADDRDADLAEAFAELSEVHRARVRVDADGELLAEAEQEVEALLAERESEGAPYRERAP